MSESLERTPKSQLSDEERVRAFQRKLYQKAKQDKGFRFYILYDKVSLPYVLREAYKRCKRKGGGPGIDNVRFEDVERKDAENLLKEIELELKEERYKPQVVLRVYIPKPNGRKRPLGIPTIRDRIVQMACKMVIEPIFEADFEDCSFGFRPKKSAGQAVKEIRGNLEKGLTDIYDADLSSYFDTIPHRELLMLLEKRISDRRIIKLIKMWLKTPVLEDGRPRGGKKNDRGTPQGGVISPLLANIYMNLIDRAVKREDGPFKRLGIRIIRYADDFILMGRKIRTEAVEYLKELIHRMRLELNRDKTRQIKATETPFDFLGFTFRYDKDVYGADKRYWNIGPSRKAEKKLRENIKDFLRKKRVAPPPYIARGMNEIIRGWLNYFTIPGTSYTLYARRRLRRYLFEKLSLFYRKKSQRKSRLYRKGAYNVLIEKYHLIEPCTC